MFKLDDRQTYWHPVEVPMLNAETARKQNFTFQGEFFRLPQAELEDLLQRIREGTENGKPVRDREVVDLVFKGWKDIVDADDSQLEVNDTNRDRLLQRHPVQTQIVKAWMKSLGFEGRAKN